MTAAVRPQKVLEIAVILICRKSLCCSGFTVKPDFGEMEMHGGGVYLADNTLVRDALLFFALFCPMLRCNAIMQIRGFEWLGPD